MPFRLGDSADDDIKKEKRQSAASSDIHVEDETAAAQQIVAEAIKNIDPGPVLQIRVQMEASDDRIRAASGPSPSTALGRRIQRRHEVNAGKSPASDDRYRRASHLGVFSRPWRRRSGLGNRRGSAELNITGVPKK